MTTITIEEAQANLSELIDRLIPGEPLVIVRGKKPVARLVTEEGSQPRQPRRPGNCKGMMTIVADDDEHLRDFAEYME